MRNTIIAAALGLAVAAVPTGVGAQGRWQSIDGRQSSLYQRIEQGVRAGTLTRPEAGRLRSQFQQLNRLETRYRAGGLSGWERRDLDRRFDALSASIRVDKHDRQHRRHR